MHKSAILSAFLKAVVDTVRTGHVAPEDVEGLVHSVVAHILKHDVSPG